MKSKSCPPDHLLGRYSNGVLSEAEADTVNAHLELCPTCLDKLNSLATHPDHFVAALRSPSAADSEFHPALARALAAVSGRSASNDHAHELEPGISLSDYRILEELGRGGMGRVYRAIHPRLGQEVALKVLRPGIDSIPILARFKAERQALALMDHPHIARVLDGGVSEDSRPFFVMELVRGVAITRYADEHYLDLRRRLELFISVCQAVQHAHQKGIIHRDLKPSNVLVAEYDGKPAPKVIDFGVAKAIEARATIQTEVGMLVGTPEYMSPEQADLTANDVDTRSDIYALGVLLYELLTGDTPFARRRLRETPILEILRVIREEEPPAPSARLVFAADTAKLGKEVRGELDWIVLKCLEKDRSRRYGTAAALAEDVQRYLDNEPVLARPLSRAYLTRKFLRRHRIPVIAAASVLLALVAGIIGTTTGWVRANHESNEKQTALTAEKSALAQARTALATLTDEVVRRILARQTAISGDERSFLQKIIAEHVKFDSVMGNTEQSRAIRADGYHQVGVVRFALGEHPEALAALKESQELHRQLVTDFPNEEKHRHGLAENSTWLARALETTGQFDDANATYREGIALFEQMIISETTDQFIRAKHASCLLNRAHLLRRLSEFGEAESEYRRVLAIAEQLTREWPDHLESHRILGSCFGGIGNICRAIKKPAEAVIQFDRAIAVFAPLTVRLPGHLDTVMNLATMHYNRANAFNEIKDSPAAEADYLRAIAIQTKLATEYPSVPRVRTDLARSHNNLGGVFHSRKRSEDAEREYRAALDIRKQLIKEHPDEITYAQDAGGSYCNFAGMLRDKGEIEEALQCYEQAIELLASVVQQSPRLRIAKQFLFNSYSGRALALHRLKRYGEAMPDWDRVIELADDAKRDEYRLSRAACLARVAPAKAVAEAESLSNGGQISPPTLFTAANVCALAAAHVETSAERKVFADRSMTLLRRAEERGYFNERARVEQLKNEANLEALRGRADFSDLIRRLEASFATAKPTPRS